MVRDLLASFDARIVKSLAVVEPPWLIRDLLVFSELRLTVSVKEYEGACHAAQRPLRV